MRSLIFKRYEQDRVDVQFIPLFALHISRLELLQTLPDTRWPLRFAAWCRGYATFWLHFLVLFVTIYILCVYDAKPQCLPFQHRISSNNYQF